ncbi:MAG: outer spore coat protein CotE [Bacilli bacterium]|nr:outer spore coat protein CotE [Bacilli bacterium]
MTTYREIVTKAVVGKGKKFFRNSYSLTPEVDVDTVLGCWVINHKFKGYEKKDIVIVEGSYDVDMWYSYDNDTKTAVMSKTIEYSEEINIGVNEDLDLSTEKDIIVRALKQPNCIKVDIKDDTIEYIIEKELGVEIVGEVKIKVEIDTNEEPWQDLTEAEEEFISEIEPDIDKEIEESIEEDFI